ncbi:hypothetical protein CspeluHIS016_0902650 [Cutaneotrichosporon spelunceum]|uniref:Uncharacterized protein n=1 Tax=Cutaneotrichosporon spelunceum TaxID=1672016 RepID=A0AAD3U093_9TREE|nr:hypothetical protein CspeluHIS016_0902650 [Cutaneotrichosporon spelunceum]
MPSDVAPSPKRHKPSNTNYPIQIPNLYCPSYPFADDELDITVDDWYTNTKFRWHSEMDDQYRRIDTDPEDAQHRIYHAAAMANYYIKRHCQLNGVSPLPETGPYEDHASDDGYLGQLPKDLMAEFKNYFASHPFRPQAEAMGNAANIAVSTIPTDASNIVYEGLQDRELGRVAVTTETITALPAGHQTELPVNEEMYQYRQSRGEPLHTQATRGSEPPMLAGPLLGPTVFSAPV